MAGTLFGLRSGRAVCQDGQERRCMGMKRICNLLIVVLMLSLAMGAVGCGAEFVVSSFDASPEACLAGDAVVVSATLTNAGGTEGEYVAELSVNGVTEQSETLALGPKSSQPLSFTLTKNEPGRYDVQLGELTASFTILGAGNLEISPFEVEVGQPVTVSADLHNVAETEATYHCCLLYQGKEVTAKDVTVTANSREKVTFTWAPAASGTYGVELLGLSGSLKVFKPAEFKVINLDIAPNPVKVGEEVTITATIENVGEATGTYDASLLVDGAVLQTTEVTLAAGVTETVSFAISKESPSNYDIEINGQQLTLRVVQPVRPPTGTYFLNELSRGEKSRLRLKNQRELDIVAVLCSSQQPNTPLAVVYIQADDSHTIMKVPEATYILYYTLGQDWDDEAKKFLEEVGYYRFSDEFHFSESSSKYTIWTVTFGGVEGVGAPIGTVNEDEFPMLG